MPDRDIPPEMWLRVVTFAGSEAARSCLYVSKKLHGVALPTVYDYVTLKDCEATRSLCTSLLSPKGHISFLRHLSLCTYFLTSRALKPSKPAPLQQYTHPATHRPTLQLFSTVLEQLAKSRALRTIRFEDPPHSLLTLPGFQPDSQLGAFVHHMLISDMAPVHLNLVNVTTLSIGHIPRDLQKYLSDKAVFTALTTFSGDLTSFSVLSQKHLTLEHVSIREESLHWGSPHWLVAEDIAMLFAALKRVSLKSLAVGLEFDFDSTHATLFWTKLAETAQNLQCLAVTISIPLEESDGSRGYSVRLLYLPLEVQMNSLTRCSSCSWTLPLSRALILSETCVVYGYIWLR